MQLSGDEQLLSLDDALDLVAQFRPASRIGRSSEQETQPLASCCGRLLADDLFAAHDVPHFANAAVDGFAFTFDDLNSDSTTQLSVAFEVSTGTSPPRALATGEAARVYTGAALPEHADSVVMEEDVRSEGNCVFVPQGLVRGANRREAGDDILRGSLLLTKGRRLDAVDCAVLASLGVTRAQVLPRLRVALFSSGKELLRAHEQADKKLDLAQIFDSNVVLLRNWLARLGCEVVEGGILPDEADAVFEALDATLQQFPKPPDLLLASGGMSQSNLDGIARLLSQQRAFAFWRVALKPGRPVGIASLRLPSAEAPLPFAGLPGNPIACFLTFGLLVQPLIRRLSGEQPSEPRRFKAKLGFSGKKKHGRREFVRTTIVPTKERTTGREAKDAFCLPILAKHGKSGAGVLSSLLDADGFAELTEETTRYDAGDIVDFLPLSEILPR